MKNLLKNCLLITFMSLFTSGCKSIINKMAFYPDKGYVIQQEHLPEGVNEIVLTTEDGINIHGLYLPNDQSDKILIYLHGNAGNIYHRLQSLMTLREFGVSVLGVSYRGYGKSGGSVSEEGIYMDSEAFVEYAKNQLRYSYDKVFVLGRSIGTTAAVSSAQFRELAGLILITPITSAREQAEYSGLGILSALAGDAFNNTKKIKNIKSRLLVIHGTHDSILPFSMGKEIFDLAPVKEKYFVAIEGGDHNDLQDSFAEQYWSAIRQFILAR